MKILHYTLGFSPYRSGGLAKYTTDLMLAQSALGHDVATLYPGGCSLFHKRGYVHREKDFEEVKVFELTNPLPVPLLYGISNPGAMINERHLDVLSFEQMLDEVHPDVFHVHTLMGLPKAYLQIVKDRDINIVYTSHDYFGLCPKVNFINGKGLCCDSPCERNCSACNRKSKGKWFLRLRNAKWIVPFKRLGRRLIK